MEEDRCPVVAGILQKVHPLPSPTLHGTRSRPLYAVRRQTVLLVLRTSCRQQSFFVVVRVVRHSLYGGTEGLYYTVGSRVAYSYSKSNSLGLDLHENVLDEGRREKNIRPQGPWCVARCGTWGRE